MDASNLLKPALQGGKLRTMGSTTYKEFRQHFEKDRALSRRFQKIDVNEPTVEDSIKILERSETLFRGASRHQIHRRTRSRPRSNCRRATSTTANCPTRPSTSLTRPEPRSIWCAESKRRKTIGVKEIEAVVAKIARIPPKNVSKDDAEVLKDLEARR